MCISGLVCRIITLLGEMTRFGDGRKGQLAESAHRDERDPTYGLAKKSAWFLRVEGVGVHLQLVQWKAAESVSAGGRGRVVREETSLYPSPSIR
jgi:hypothetical protein